MHIKIYTVTKHKNAEEGIGKLYALQRSGVSLYILAPWP